MLAAQLLELSWCRVVAHEPGTVIHDSNWSKQIGLHIVIRCPGGFFLLCASSISFPRITSLDPIATALHDDPFTSCASSALSISGVVVANQTQPGSGYAHLQSAVRVGESGEGDNGQMYFSHGASFGLYSILLGTTPDWAGQGSYHMVAGGRSAGRGGYRALKSDALPSLRSKGGRWKDLSTCRLNHSAMSGSDCRRVHCAPCF